jgi:two-component system response regulator YesN
MLVEDEPRALSRYEHYLQEYKGDFEIVAEAMTYQDAEAKFPEAKPDAIFTDIIIPGGNGLQFLEHVRSQGWAGLFVVISGYDNFCYAQKAIKLGAFDYLLKPIFKNDFFAMLDNVKNRLAGIRIVDDAYYKDTYPLFLRKAMQYVEHNYRRTVLLTDVAEASGVSPAYLSATFTKLVGITFVDYVKYYRIAVAAAFLEKNPCDVSLDDLAEKVGFCDASYLTHCFKEIRGITPRKYQSEMRGSS